MNQSLRVALGALCLLSLTACGAKEVPKEEVEKQAMAVLTKTVGKEAPQITCPGNLKAEVGTVMVCGMPLEGKTYDVNIKVTEVEGGNAKFDVAVADKPRS
jgi:hypothetical protein